MNKKHIQLIFFLTPIIIILLFILFSKPKKDWEQEGRVFSPRDKTLTKWASGEFIPVTTNEDFRQQLDTIPLSTTNVTLDDAQTGELRESIYNFVMAYHVGSYGAYEKFRLPIQYKSFDQVIIQFERQSLTKLFPDRQLPRKDPVEVDKEWWNYWDEISTNMAPNAKPKQRYCTRCLQEVDVKRGAIVVERQSQVPRALNYYVTSFDNVGYAEANPTFVFDPNPETLAAKGGQITTAVVSLIFKHDGDPPYPLFCRFYWVDTGKKWVPIELVGAFAQKTLVYNF